MVSGIQATSARDKTYRTVEHILSGISALLDMTLQRTRIQRLEKLEATEQIARNGHDGTPIVKLSAVLNKG